MCVYVCACVCVFVCVFLPRQPSTILFFSYLHTVCPIMPFRRTHLPGRISGHFTVRVFHPHNIYYIYQDGYRLVTAHMCNDFIMLPNWEVGPPASLHNIPLVCVCVPPSPAFYNPLLQLSPHCLSHNALPANAPTRPHFRSLHSQGFSSSQHILYISRRVPACDSAHV